jgi:tetratricopeptide (TPR) repeat protein
MHVVTRICLSCAARARALRAGRFLAALLLVAASAGTSLVLAQVPRPIIDLIDVNQRDSQVDITMQFGCSLFYIAHLPAQQGPEVRIRFRPGPDCGIGFGGQIPDQLPSLTGTEGIIQSARIDSDVPGEIALTLSWAKPETFILAQGADLHGLRIRLLRVPRGHVAVAQQSEQVATFAVNLDSQREPFTQEAIDLAAQRLKTPVFVSQAELEGEKWYRLRAGPFDRQSIAEQVLRVAATDYPRVWLAVGDEAAGGPAATLAEGPLPPIERIGVDPPLDATIRQGLLSDARKALSAHDFTQAVTLLTKLQRQPEFPERAQAQELLGLARERAGQLAHAKAEYEEYLRRYPHGAAAERVRERLRILRNAGASSQAAGGGGDSQLGWRTSADFSQLYVRDSTQITSTGVTTQFAPQNGILNDANVLTRRRGENLDFAGRLSAGIEKDFGGGAPGNQTRVSAAYLELSDRAHGVTGRLGRQIDFQDGALGTFDGLAVSYQFRSNWSVDGTIGAPVESVLQGVQTERHLETLALAYSSLNARWHASTFVATQQYDGRRDRQAVGGQVSYFLPQASVVGLIDYDTAYHSFNAAVVLGTLQLPDRWTLSYDAERRNSPVLTTRNALIGQPVTSLTALSRTFSDEQIYQLARDRTPTLSVFEVSATRPLGERFQFTADVIDTNSGATIDSGGVAAQPSNRDLAYQLQFFGNSLFSAGDFNLLVLRYDQESTERVISAAVTSRVALFGAWRLSPRFRVDEQQLSSDGSRQLLYAPSMRLDYQRDRRMFELEFGYQIGRNELSLQSSETRGYFLDIGYRYGF